MEGLSLNDKMIFKVICSAAGMVFASAGFSVEPAPLSPKGDVDTAASSLLDSAARN